MYIYVYIYIYWVNAVVPMFLEREGLLVPLFKQAVLEVLLS